MTFQLHIPADGRFTYLTTMRLITDLEFAIAGKEDFYSIGFKDAIYNQVPAKEILQNCKGIINDAPEFMQNLIGVNLAQRIKDYQL